MCGAERSESRSRSADPAGRWSARRLRSQDLLRRPGDRRCADGLRHEERDLLEIVSQVHGLLRPRELRLLHPCRVGNVLLKERDSTRSAPEAASRRTSTTSTELATHRQDREPLRARTDLAQSGALDARELQFEYEAP